MAMTYVKARNFLTKSKLNDGLTCNPYSGCGHGCLYCYANYMVPNRKDYDAWGDYVEIREYPHYDIPHGTGAKQVIFSSATDSYQPVEAQVLATRKIMEAIHESDLKFQILTKSDLVLRDIDLFKQMRSVEVGLSISLNDAAAIIFEPGASAPSTRIEAIRKLKAANIDTYVFVAPIFPYLTDVIRLIDELRGACDYFMFDTLNLSHPHNKAKILGLIREHYPEHYQDYRKIFIEGDKAYYRKLKAEIISHMQTRGLKYTSIYY